MHPQVIGLTLNFKATKIQRLTTLPGGKRHSFAWDRLQPRPEKKIWQ
jgi:hypothetical protein